MNNLAIIPARGGSKRIPRKNVKDFLGKPIIAYSIEKALESKLFSEVMVSTDDQEIADIAMQFGASVPTLRSSKNADDHASTIDVLSEVVEYYASLNKQFDHVCCIYPTAPLISIEDLITGLKLLQEDSVHSVFPVVAFSYPIWRGLKSLGNNQMQMIWPDNIEVRTQNLDQAYHDAGQWYWFEAKKIGLTIFNEHSRSIILDELNVQDIDNLADWKMAEIKYEFSRKG